MRIRTLALLADELLRLRRARTLQLDHHSHFGAATLFRRGLSKSLRIVALALLAIGMPPFIEAGTVQLINNGTFGTGSFADWTETNQAGGLGSWYVLSGTTEPVSGHPTVGPDGTTYYASTDQNGGGAHALTQSFLVPLGTTSLDLSFDMFINDLAGVTDCSDLDYTVTPTQCAYVAVLQNGSNPLTTTAGVVDALFSGGGTDSTNPWVAFNYVITNLTPGDTYELQFAEADNQSFFNMGVDNVSLIANTTSATPEPPSLMLLATGLLGVAGLLRRRVGHI
jgi:hypothetical protein